MRISFPLIEFSAIYGSLGAEILKKSRNAQPTSSPAAQSALEQKSFFPLLQKSSSALSDQHLEQNLISSLIKRVCVSSSARQNRKAEDWSARKLVEEKNANFPAAQSAGLRCWALKLVSRRFLITALPQTRLFNFRPGLEASSSGCLSL